MIAAALTALPLIAEAGQGLIKTVGQDVASFLGGGQAGQNVPAPASSTSPSLTRAAQTLSSDMLSVLSSAQSGLGSVAGFASGQSSISKPQLESLAAGAAGALGQNTASAAADAGQVFDAVDTGQTGQISGPQVASFLDGLQSQATSRYQAANSLAAGFAQQFAGLLTTPTSVTA